MIHGRWTIVARVARGQRRPGEYPRERVLVRCVCGYERVIWLQDMQPGRSTGCDSRLCAARYLVADDIRRALSEWSQRERTYLEQRVGPRSALRACLTELARDREASIEHVIETFLRGPREPERLMAAR